MGKLTRFVPLALLLAFVGFVAWRLANPADTAVRSRLAGQPVPQFALPAALPGTPGLASADLASGQGPRLVNIFASWCVPCIAEAPVLTQLAQRGATLDGIAVRDRPEDLARFVQRTAVPFARIGDDRDSRVQMAFGSAGVPESFIVDGRGIIRYQHIGPIEPADIPVILAELDKAK